MNQFTQLGHFNTNHKIPLFSYPQFPQMSLPIIQSLTCTYLFWETAFLFTFFIYLFVNQQCFFSWSCSFFNLSHIPTKEPPFLLLFAPSPNWLTSTHPASNKPPVTFVPNHKCMDFSNYLFTARPCAFPAAWRAVFTLRRSACSSLWSSFSQWINICMLSSSLCRWAW